MRVALIYGDLDTVSAQPLRERETADAATDDAYVDHSEVSRQ